MEAMTSRCSGVSGWMARYASPCARKMSATSGPDRRGLSSCAKGPRGPVPRYPSTLASLVPSSSNGLLTRRICSALTCIWICVVWIELCPGSA